MKSLAANLRFVLAGLALAAPALATPPKPEFFPVVQETMISLGGNVSFTLDGSALAASGLQLNSDGAGRFAAEPGSTFQIVVSNEEFGRAIPGELVFSPGWTLSGSNGGAHSLSTLILQPAAPGSGPDFVIRNLQGQALFTVIGTNYDFDSATDNFAIVGAQVRLALGVVPGEDSGPLVGSLSADLIMQTTETVVLMPNGTALGGTIPADGVEPAGGPNAGPDVIVGELLSPAQFGRVGSAVGLAIGTTSCNKGNVPLNWFQMPNVDHPVICQNLYRLKNDRFEQIGQAWLKHGFTALQGNACGFGCTSGCSGSQLCNGCSDPYDAGLNSGPSLGSRAWVQPFTGAYTSSANTHTGHSHNGISHRLIVQDSDFDPALNAGATYYFEGQYVTRHEYLPNNGVANNQYNNASYKRYNVSGSVGGTWSFAAVGATVREQPAINVWTGSTQALIEPAPGVDGRAYLAYKVTNLGGGQYHYEYLVYNMNLDRCVQSLSIPVDDSVTLSSVEFRGPPQHPGWTFDNTAGNAGYSSAAWTSTRTASDQIWASETLAQNANANAVRWGTLCNYRFDANSPPVAVNATIGFFKTGAPITVATLGPAPVVLPCPEDCSGDGSRNQADLALLLSCYDGGPCCDIDGDGDTDQADLAALLAVYETPCP